ASVVASAIAVFSLACADLAQISMPTGLTYSLDASGTPGAPAGVLLSWTGVTDADLSGYRVYARPDDSSPWTLIGTTNYNTFHDNGAPSLEYYVTAISTSNSESAPSATVVVDERLALNAPASLNTTSLNGAIFLAWSDNPYQAAPNGFKQYRVYSTSYDLDN